MPKETTEQPAEQPAPPSLEERLTTLAGQTATFFHELDALRVLVNRLQSSPAAADAATVDALRKELELYIPQLRQGGQ